MELIFPFNCNWNVDGFDFTPNMRGENLNQK